MDWLDAIKWDRDGLVPVIAQEQGTGDVLMFAWMNREALAETARRGQAVYWSRSRQRAAGPIVMPSSSCSSRASACSTVSPGSSLPPGNSQ